MDINAILSTIFTSTAISGLIAFVLKTYLENKIKNKFEKEKEQLLHSYEIEIEKLRHQFAIELQRVEANLNIIADINKEIVERRFNEYPSLVELVYRARNMARDITNNPESSFSLCSEFIARAKELEDLLYKYRIDLERDKVFIEIHRYKNLLKNFGMLLEDAIFYREKGDAPRVREYVAQIHNYYQDIEQFHKPIIERLSKMDQINLDATSVDEKA